MGIIFSVYAELICVYATVVWGLIFWRRIIFCLCWQWLFIFFLKTLLVLLFCDSFNVIILSKLIVFYWKGVIKRLILFLICLFLCCALCIKFLCCMFILFTFIDTLISPLNCSFISVFNWWLKFYLNHL